MSPTASKEPRAKKDETFVAFVLEQLDGAPSVESRAMFGGHALYHSDAIFGIVFRGRLYFRVSEKSLPDFVRHGMKPFRPNAKQTMRSYWEVPLAVLESRGELKRWARRAWSG